MCYTRTCFPGVKRQHSINGILSELRWYSSARLERLAGALLTPPQSETARTNSKTVPTQTPRLSCKLLQFSGMWIFVCRLPAQGVLTFNPFPFPSFHASDPSDPPAYQGKPRGVPSSCGSRDRRDIGGRDQWGAVTKAWSPKNTSTWEKKTKRSRHFQSDGPFAHMKCSSLGISGPSECGFAPSKQGILQSRRRIWLGRKKTTFAT